MNCITRLLALLWRPAFSVLCLLLACGCTHPGSVTPQPVSHFTKNNCPTTSLVLNEAKEEAQIVRVVDGDTIVTNGKIKIRLVGVDTPESVHPKKPVEHYSVEASAFTRTHIDGKAVILVFDQSNSATKHRDRYGRLLAYVYRKDDGFDLNAELIKQGYAHAYTKYPIERLEEFRCYEKEAREAGRGLWK